MIKTNGINVRVAEAGEGPLVLLVHGWPESWYSWRHQIVALAAAGYHAVAPDVRGYGGSDKPHAVEAYSMKEITADMLGILDEAGAKTAVIVGHDWGSAIAWNSAALFPDRYRGVVGMSVPFLPRSPMPPTQLLKAAFGENWFYILYFQDEGKAEAEFEADVYKTMRTILAAQPGVEGESFTPTTKPKTAKFFDNVPPAPATLPDWLSEGDLEYFVNEFKSSGFRGGLNRYRNMDRDWQELPQLADAKITMPAMFVTGDKDPVRTFAPAEAMKAAIPNLREVVLPGGHWIQQERAKDVNDALLSYLKELPS
jgi:pimeloyl-ACP methyl ester carboxylesterase